MFQFLGQVFHSLFLLLNIHKDPFSLEDIVETTTCPRTDFSLCVQIRLGIYFTQKVLPCSHCFICFLMHELSDGEKKESKKANGSINRAYKSLSCVRRVRANVTTWDLLGEDCEKFMKIGWTSGWAYISFDRSFSFRSHFSFQASRTSFHPLIGN